MSPKKRCPKGTKKHICCKKSPKKSPKAKKSPKKSPKKSTKAKKSAKAAKSPKAQGKYPRIRWSKGIRYIKTGAHAPSRAPYYIRDYYTLADKKAGLKYWESDDAAGMKNRLFKPQK
jgi:hypothetical protein